MAVDIDESGAPVYTAFDPLAAGGDGDALDLPPEIGAALAELGYAAGD